MNQAASATRRPPADSAPSAGGCCPMLNASFFGLQTPAAAASQCFLNPQIVQLARQHQQQQSNVVLSPQQQTVSQQPPSAMLGQQQLPAQPQQQTTQRSHDQTSNHYSTSLTAPSLSLQQSIVNRHSIPNCAAIAAAVASFPQFQQQLLMTQNHQATHINQPTQTVAPSTTVTQPNAPPTFTTQVPPYNSYSSAQPFINLNRHTIPQSAPPVSAHHQQTNNIPNTILSPSLNLIAQNTPLSNSANNLHQNVQQSSRPLVTNAALNSSTSQLADSIYRSAQQQPTDQAPPNVHQQQSSTPTPTPAQQLGQASPQTVPQIPPVPMQPQSHQLPQPPQASFGLPFYPYTSDRTLDQVMAILANPTLTNNLLSYVLSHISNGLRMEQHPHHFPAHHFHSHLNGTHHHHHSQNGQANGQDTSMPLDSISINESKPRGLTRAEIDSLTPYMHTNEKDSRSCVICLSKFELKSKIRPLPCNHAFHAKCVDKWLRTNRTCPICRRDALKTFNGKIKRI